MRLLAAIRDAIDSDAIDAAADQIGQALAQRRDAFSLRVVVSERGIRPALVERACERVFARVLGQAWEDHKLTETEIDELDRISRVLRLSQAQIRAASELAMQNSLRRQDGLPPIRSTVGSVLRDYLRELLGRTPTAAARPVAVRTRADRSQVEAAELERRGFELLSQADPGRTRTESGESPVRRSTRSASWRGWESPRPATGTLGPFLWIPPENAAAYRQIEESLERGLTDHQRWLGLSLGIDVDTYETSEAISRLDEMAQATKEDRPRRMEMLRRQIRALGGKPTGETLYHLFEELCDRVPAVEVAQGRRLYFLLCAGVSAPRAFSTAEAISIDNQLSTRSRHAVCRYCGAKFERFMVICHCDEGCAWHDPWQPRLWKLNPRLGVEWWRA